MQILISLLAFLVAIGVLVTVHEFGHFIVARRLGIKVLRFSVGFGKPLYTWHRHGDDTEYVVAALPLGGYVKMADEREGQVAEVDLPRAFNRQPIYKRLLVVLAGPVFNLAFAVLAYWVIYMAGIQGIRPIVGDITPGSPAAVAGFEPRDQIVSVAGDETHTWDAAGLALFQGIMDGHKVQVGVQQPAGSVRQLTLTVTDTKSLTAPDQLLPGLGLTEWDPPIPPLIGQLEAGGSATASGLKVGDRILELEGKPLASWQDMTAAIRASGGKTLDLTIERAGKQEPLALHVGTQTKDGVTQGHIGAGPQIPKDFYAGLLAEQRYNPPAAFWQALKRTGDLAWLTLDAAWNMVLGNVSWRNISGPINIAQYAGYTAESGLVPFLAFLAIVSISLGVLNLLPVPVLDGGHVLYFAAEFVKGSPLSERVEVMGQRVGMALLMLLMGFAVYNDLVRVFS